MPEDKTTTKKPKLSEADQDQLIQDFITETSQLIAIIKKEPGLLPELARLAFDEAELTNGEDLALTAQNSFTERQEAIGTLDAKNAALEKADKLVNKRGTDFRDVVRLGFSDAAALRALGVTGRLPEDRQKRITQLRASFATAAKPPYAAEMTRRSYDTAELALATADVNALDTALTNRDAAARASVAATAARNTDYKALRAWRTSFNRAIKRARTRLT